MKCKSNTYSQMLIYTKETELMVIKIQVHIIIQGDFINIPWGLTILKQYFYVRRTVTLVLDSYNPTLSTITHL